MAERKSWVELALMPLVITLVGVGGTYFVTSQQEKSTEVMRQAQLESALKTAEANRLIKVLDIFSGMITSSDEKQRMRGLRFVGAMDDNLAEELASAVAEGEDETPEVRRVAREVAQKAAARRAGAPLVLIRIRRENDRAAAKTVGDALSKKGFAVPGIERLADVGPSVSQVRYFRADDRAQADEIVRLWIPWAFGPRCPTSRAAKTPPPCGPAILKFGSQPANRRSEQQGQPNGFQPFAALVGTPSRNSNSISNLLFLASFQQLRHDFAYPMPLMETKRNYPDHQGTGSS